jgi:hypothetical protein
MQPLPAAVERSSRLNVPAGRAWSDAVTEAGIAWEMRPFFRMTMPPGARGRTIDDVPVGEPLGRAWLLLFGVVPVDYDDLTIAELGPGRRFLERSSMALLCDWQHERVVEADGPDACLVTDRLGFVVRSPLARVPGSRRIAARLVGAFFSHRHRRLRERHGGSAGDEPLHQRRSFAREA